MTHDDMLVSAYEIGQMAGEFGEDTLESLDCHCPDCHTEYERGIDDGLAKSLRTVQP